MNSHTGELAALLTTVFWTVTALSFEVAGKRIGSLHLNLFRLGIALVFLALFSFFSRGLLLPVDASSHAWLWLSLSGLVGFVLGDFCLFQAFILIGARISLLIMTLAPVFASLAGFLILGEKMNGTALLGMMITVAGIALVIAGRAPSAVQTAAKPRSLGFNIPVKGVVLAVLAALGQGIGLVLSKLGMGDYSPFAATQIRVIAGFLGFVILFSLLGQWPKLSSSLHDRKALAFTTLGSFFGPFLGVSFSLLAVQHTHAGIAQTIMSLTPVIIIPPAILINKEKIRFREIMGALIAVAGVSLFFF